MYLELSDCLVFSMCHLACLLPRPVYELVTLYHFRFFAEEVQDFLSGGRNSLFIPTILSLRYDLVYQNSYHSFVLCLSCTPFTPIRFFKSPVSK